MFLGEFSITNSIFSLSNPPQPFHEKQAFFRASVMFGCVSIGRIVSVSAIFSFILPCSKIYLSRLQKQAVHRHQFQSAPQRESARDPTRSIQIRAKVCRLGDRPQFLKRRPQSVRIFMRYSPIRTTSKSFSCRSSVRLPSLNSSRSVLQLPALHMLMYFAAFKSIRTPFSCSERVTRMNTIGDRRRFRVSKGPECRQAGFLNHSCPLTQCLSR